MQEFIKPNHPLTQTAKHPNLSQQQLSSPAQIPWNGPRPGTQLLVLLCVRVCPSLATSESEEDSLVFVRASHPQRRVQKLGIQPTFNNK